MRCRETAYFGASILSGSPKLSPIFAVILLLAFHERSAISEGARFGRVLKQNNNGTTTEDIPSVSETIVTNAMSFHRALAQQNITTINIGSDIRLNSSIWIHGTDSTPETGIKILRNLTIITLPSLDKQRVIYLDYMVNRIIVDTNITLTINGVVFKEVNKFAERSIGIPFIHFNDRSTIFIRNSQFQFAIDSSRGYALNVYPTMLMSRQTPDGYEDWRPQIITLSKEQCMENRIRRVSCKDGALFVFLLASVVTPFNTTRHATGKAVYLIQNVLLDAKDARRFPELNPTTVEVSSAIELRRAFLNKRIKEIFVMRDLEITDDYFTDKERIPIARDLTIESHPSLNKTATIWLNFIEEAVEVDQSVRIKVRNLGFAGVSRKPVVHERIPFFRFLDQASLVLRNVTGELAIDTNERDYFPQLPFVLYGAVLHGENVEEGNIVRAVDSAWCLTDGRIECPIGALLIVSGSRSFHVKNENSDVIGQWYIDSINVLVKAIDITKPIPQFNAEAGGDSPNPDASLLVEAQGEVMDISSEDDGSGTENGDSVKEKKTSYWILIYLLVTTAAIMALLLLVITFYRRREQRKSTPSKESRIEHSSVPEDDGLREHQAIARQLLGDVKLGSLLGCGSFGRVYKATWSGAQVAVKVILHQEDEQEVIQEAVFSLSLRHPNVVQTYHYAVRALESCPAPVKQDQQQDDDDNDTQSNPKCVTSAPQVKHHGMDIPSSWVRTSYSGESSKRSATAITTDTMQSRQTTAETSTTQSRLDEEEESWMEMWLIQEYCELGSVGRQNTLRLNSQSSVWSGRRGDLGMIIDTCKDIARGMKYLHDNGVVHGDLKCDNLLLQGSHTSSKGFVAKVADFGLSRKLGHVTHLSTRSFGTITHMPPELLLEGHLSPRVDVYSFGIIMWELWSGETPFRNMRYAEVMRAIVVDDRRPEYDGDAPPEYVSLSLRCWDKDPRRRPSFDHVLEELDEFSKLLTSDNTYTTDASQGRSTIASP